MLSLFGIACWKFGSMHEFAKKLDEVVLDYAERDVHGGSYVAASDQLLGLENEAQSGIPSVGTQPFQMDSQGAAPTARDFLNHLFMVQMMQLYTTA